MNQAVKTKSNDNIKELEKFGKYHIIQYCFICIPLFMVSMMHVNYIFVAEEVKFRCKVPECESGDPSIEPPSWWPNNIDTRCQKPLLDAEKYNLTNTIHMCTNTSFYNIVEDCHDWIYENNHSIVAEFNLGCEQWKATLVGSIHNAGMIVSMLFTGWIADKIGRKPTTIICSVGGCIGVLKIFLKNYYAYIAVELLESVIVSGLYTVAVVLMIEVGGDTKRVITGIIFSYAIYTGEIVFAFIAMGLKFWKALILVVYAPVILFLIYVFVLRESTRWEMIRGKMDDAKSTFKIIAKINKLDLTEKEIDDVDDKELTSKFNVRGQSEKENMKVIFHSKEMVTRLSVTSFCFFASSFLYYGLVVHSVLLPGNKYTNFILSSLTSFPGEVMSYYSFNKFGRKISLQTAYLCCAIFLIAQTFSPDTITWLKIVLFLAGKLCVVICFTGIYTYSLELFPTSVRGSLFGWGNTAARIGSMLAPLTPLLVTGMPALPSILFSSTAVIAAVLLTFTPETKFLPMFDTIAQVEAFNQKDSTQF